MKIVLISRGRTCSTAISKSLAHLNNVEYLGETYFNTVHDNFVRHRTYRPKFSKEKVFTEFYQKLEVHTQSTFLKNDFLVKLFPSILHMPPNKMYKSDIFNSIKPYIISNLDVLKITEYDKFYFLDRQFYNSIVSWVYSKKSLIWHQNKINPKKYTKIYLDKLDFATAKFYILEYFLQQKIRDYLNNKNIPYTYIDESNYDQFIDTNILSTTKTEINYKDYITNIEELDVFIDYWYPIIKQETYDWFFY